MLAASYGDSLRGGIMSLNALKNEKPSIRIQSLRDLLKIFQCLHIVIDSLNMWNKFCLNLTHFSK